MVGNSRCRLTPRLILPPRAAEPDDTTRAQAAYEVPPLTDLKQARRVAQDIERRIQAACASALGASDRRDRMLPLIGLRTAALAELTWGGTAQPFPGLD